MKKTGLKDLTLTDMKAYHRATDWSEMWILFYQTVAANGLPLYRTVQHFARVQGRNPLQKEFLKYYLGAPRDSKDQLSVKYSFCTPLHWEEKRSLGVGKSIDLAAKEFRKRENALDALREAGNSVTVRAFFTLGKMLEELQNIYSAGLFLPDLTLKQNTLRAKGAFDMMDRLLQLIGFSQDQVAKSLGINFNDMDGFGSIMAAAASHHNAEKTGELTGVLKDMIEMTLRKKQSFPDHVELSAEFEEKLLEAPMKASKPQ